MTVLARNVPRTYSNRIRLNFIKKQLNLYSKTDIFHRNFHILIHSQLNDPIIIEILITFLYILIQNTRSTNPKYKFNYKIKLETPTNEPSKVPSISVHRLAYSTGDVTRRPYTHTPP